MRLRPDNLPDMVKGEQRVVTFSLAGAVGANTITDFEIASEPDRLSFGTASTSGTNVSIRVDADEAGVYKILPTATLSSGEIVKGVVEVKIRDPLNEPVSDDYNG